MMLSAAAWRSTCSALSLHVGSPRVGAGPFHANSSTCNIVGGAIFNFLGVRHASTQKKSFKSEKLASTQSFQRKPFRKSTDSKSGSNFSKRDSKQGSNFSKRDSSSRNRESYFRKSSSKSGVQPASDDTFNTFKSNPEVIKNYKRDAGDRREGGDKKRWGGRDKVPYWKKAKEAQLPENKKALSKKMSGKLKFPTHEEEEPKTKEPPRPRAPPKVVNRGEVLKTISIPQKGGDKTDSGKTFQQLGLKPIVIEALKSIDVSKPTLIQEMAVPAILKSRQNLVFAAQTGTGKTLAYLVPIAQQLKREEEEEGYKLSKEEKENNASTKKKQNKKVEEEQEEQVTQEHEEKDEVEEEEDEDNEEPTHEEMEEMEMEERARLKKERREKKKREQELRPSQFRRREGRPRALVLVPNRELAEQVAGVAKSLSHVVKLRSVGVSGGSALKTQLKQKLSSYIDIMVATPGRLLKHLEESKLSLRDVGYVVLDEGDSLLAKGQGFDEDLKKVFKIFERRMKKPLPEGEIPVQFVVVTATLTSALVKSIESYIPSIKTLVTPTIHKNTPNLKQKFLTVVGGDKHEILRKLVIENKSKHTIIFCNTMGSARSTEYQLKEWGYDATILHGEVPPKIRQENWKHFCESENSYLVCTDIASRGLDTTMVDYIINFDFPYNTIDYLHRIGRTARAGRSGTVVSLLAKKDTVLATGIINAVNKGMSLENVSADKTINEKLFHKVLAEKKEKRLIKEGKAPTKPVKVRVQRPKKQRGSKRTISVIPVRNKSPRIRPKKKSRKKRDTGNQ